MLARWFDRNGIGQYLAPDERAAQAEAAAKDDGSTSFWHFLAPDPNFATPKAPPEGAFAMCPDHPNQVLCMHCNRWTDASKTPARNSTKDAKTPAKTPVNDQSNPKNMFTPPRSQYKPMNDQDDISNLVLSAARDTAAGMTSPPHIREARDKVFRFCGSSKALNDKMAKRLRNLFKKNPSLINTRCSHLGQLVPDGFTPLMASAYANHVVAAEIVLEVAPKTAIWDRDLQGRTPLHIAAELGHMDIINLLLPKYQPEGVTSPAPLDILGRTPLGRAVTSPNPTARKRQKELQSALFSPNDLSVFGHAKPESERAGQNADLQIAYGIADMPGMRVTMEDAVCTKIWEHGGKSYCLLAVCDGHGDRGSVSQFVADNVPPTLQKYMEQEDLAWEAKWQKTCLEVDSKLREADIPGGSTAVMALITEDLIVVANVGDSRAILIHSSNRSGLEAEMEKLAVSENKREDPPKLQQEKEKNAESKTTPAVMALSDDHKPDLEEEKARIENAGMVVKSITFEEDGNEVTIHKVSMSDKDQLAVSRAFGDFEYKLNTTLGPEEQAVTAVADVRVHSRDPSRDMYLVLACDGVFDVMSNEQVMDFILHQVEVRKEITDTVLPEVGDALLRESLNAGSKDNMTVIVAALSKESSKIKPVIQGRALDFTSPDFMSPSK
jgi:protein phosphatase 2C family protein 2/3